MRPRALGADLCGGHTHPCSCFELKYPVTVATDQVVEHTSETRNLVAELLLVNLVPIAQYASDAGQGLLQNL